ncbi:hypothetical protein FRB99_007624 [Tulasnella sp. 403]|nr:hypothetical protein FRB99_007624 [Tulasnella sp. 403]
MLKSIGIFDDARRFVGLQVERSRDSQPNDDLDFISKSGDFVFVSPQTLEYLPDLDGYLLTTGNADLHDDDVERPTTPSDAAQVLDAEVDIEDFFVIPKTICGICYSDFLPMDSLRDELSIPPSSQNSFGVILPCPGRHNYCLVCVAAHIRTKIEDAANGRSGLPPVRCPECPVQDGWEVTDDVATKVLNGDLLEQWHFQKLLASLTPTLMYCPNPRCSVPLEEPQYSETVAATKCPMCRHPMCYKCKSAWHENLTCEEY